MEFHPIQAFKEMPAKKKAAVVAGTAVAVGTVALTAAAYSKGKTGKLNLDEVTLSNYKKAGKVKENGELKFFTRLKEGFKSIGKSITSLGKKTNKETPEKTPAETPAKPATPATPEVKPETVEVKPETVEVKPEAVEVEA